jgi:hypothetical protein
MKIIKDLLILLVLLIAASKMGNTQEIDKGGLKLKNGCFSMVIVVELENDEKKIMIIQDCRGGKSI